MTERTISPCGQRMIAQVKDSETKLCKLARKHLNIKLNIGLHRLSRFQNDLNIDKGAYRLFLQEVEEAFDVNLGHQLPETPDALLTTIGLQKKYLLTLHDTHQLGTAYTIHGMVSKKVSGTKISHTTIPYGTLEMTAAQGVTIRQTFDSSGHATGNIVKTKKINAQNDSIAIIFDARENIQNICAFNAQQQPNEELTTRLQQALTNARDMIADEKFEYTRDRNRRLLESVAAQTTFDAFALNWAMAPVLKKRHGPLPKKAAA